MRPPLRGGPRCRARLRSGMELPEWTRAPRLISAGGPKARGWVRESDGGRGAGAPGERQPEGPPGKPRGWRGLRAQACWRCAARAASPGVPTRPTTSQVFSLQSARQRRSARLVFRFSASKSGHGRPDGGRFPMASIARSDGKSMGSRRETGGSRSVRRHRPTGALPWWVWRFVDGCVD